MEEAKGELIDFYDRDADGFLTVGEMIDGGKTVGEAYDIMDIYDTNSDKNNITNDFVGTRNEDMFLLRVK